MANEFDTFDYIKPADYLPALEQRNRETNEGFENAEQMAKINDRQRVANAEQFDRAINKAEKFTKSGAELLKKQRDTAQKIYAAEAWDWQKETGVNQEDYYNWKIERQKLGEDHTQLAYLSAKAEAAGQTTQAKDLINLSGWRLQIQEEVMAKDYINRLPEKFKNEILDKDEAGNYKYQLHIKGDGETPDRIVNWGSEDLTEEEAWMLLKEFNLKNGYNPVSHYRKEFSKDVIWDTLRVNEQSIINTVKERAANNLRNETLAFHEKALIVNAQTSANDLVDMVLGLADKEKGQLKVLDNPGARTVLKEYVLNLYRQDKITYNEAQGLITGTFPHKGTGTPQTLEVFKEFQDYQGSLQSIHQIKSGEETRGKTAFGGEFTDGVIKKFKDSKVQLTEVILGIEVNNFRNDFAEKFGYYPTEAEIKLHAPRLLTLGTVEDKSDADIISKLMQKKAMLQPILYQDYANIYDPVKREEWQKYADTAAGQGMISEIKGLRDDSMPGIIKTALSLTYGPLGPQLDPLYRKYQPKAERRYNELYAQMAPNYADKQPFELHDAIVSRLSTDIKTWHETKSMDSPIESNYALQKNEALHYLKQKNPNHLTNVHVQTLSEGMLPGTKESFAQLTAYNKSPNTLSIPQLYYDIARGINGLDEFDVAALQYKAETGEDLKPPDWKVTAQKYQPLTTYYMTTKPNNKTLTKMAVIEKGGGDYNSFSLRPELTELIEESLRTNK